MMKNTRTPSNFPETDRSSGYKRPFILGRPFFPSHGENRMANEGDVRAARESFYASRFQNLDFLLRSRYAWMNCYIRPGMNVIEIGCGAGFSPLYIREKVVLTDAVSNPWVDKVIDATAMDMDAGSVDILIASHTIHHFYNPRKFFNEAIRVLKPNGMLLIHEINTSLAMRVLLRVMRHEGWSYDVDVFDCNAIINDPRDLWSANCAAPQILFHSSAVFERHFPQFKIELNEPCEFLIFPLSGGVIAKTRVPQMPLGLLKLADRIDNFLAKQVSSIFALARRVAIRKVVGAG
jgi:SAM-dependent methyltransferase